MNPNYSKFDNRKSFVLVYWNMKIAKWRKCEKNLALNSKIGFNKEASHIFLENI
jgi:hypothetical protein